MTPKKKAKKLVKKYTKTIWDSGNTVSKPMIKHCALIAVENEYNALREQLFNLRSCHVIESETVYLKRVDWLNVEEQQVKTEIEKL